MGPQISKRRFLITTAAATAAALAWEPLFSLGRVENMPSPRQLNLGGAWQVSQRGKTEWLPAQAPGCVHSDLLAAGKIPDPVCRDNENQVQWITDADWIYRRRFDVPAEVIAHDRVLLRCDGLDTRAVIKVNGAELGRAAARTSDNFVHLRPDESKVILIRPLEPLSREAFTSQLRVRSLFGTYIPV